MNMHSDSFQTSIYTYKYIDSISYTKRSRYKTIFALSQKKETKNKIEYPTQSYIKKANFISLNFYLRCFPKTKKVKHIKFFC